MRKLNFGIIGVGRFGSNYLRTLDGFDDVSVKWACSSTHEGLDSSIRKVGPRHVPALTTDYRDILEDGDVDAVAIVTPGSTHFRICRDALESGKHVIVEKPLAFSLRDTRELVEFAKKKGRILMVSDVHHFNPGVQRLVQDVRAGVLGKIRYIDMVHCGPGPVRNDMSALWDFLPHSISIALQVAGSMPLSVSVSGASFKKKSVEDVVTMDLSFPKGLFAASFSSWLSPLKIMVVTVVGDKLSGVFDDYAIQDRLRYFSPDGSCSIQQVSLDKPLSLQLKEFLKLIDAGKPLDNANLLKLMSVLESAQKSLDRKGAVVELK